MKLNYFFKDISDCVEITLEFTNEKQTKYWSDTFFEYYPDINRLKYEMLTLNEKRNFLTDYFQTMSINNKTNSEDKLCKYQSYWNVYESKITTALESIFSIELNDNFNNIKSYISFFPICPRYLSNNTFDVFYLCSEKGALGISIHEIIHLVWFNVWNEYFNDDYFEYETPHLKWILSEMVIDCIMRDDKLSFTKPFLKEDYAYSYFYTMIIDNKPILETLNDLYTSMNIQEFMKNSYNYCLKFEDEIRTHILKSENL